MQAINEETKKTVDNPSTQQTEIEAVITLPVTEEKSVLFERHGGVIVVRLNRPRKLNALNAEMMTTIANELSKYESDPAVGCFIITGNKRAFAAGADINELANSSYMDMYLKDYFAGWDTFANLRTPKIAAVSGYALGGGCELALMCDTIYASETARFGQPELKLGVIPGMGGSQRLTRLIGKSKAMDMILTGRMLDVEEAERAGMVARIIPEDDLMSETLAAAQQIAHYGNPSVIAAREAVNFALEAGLSQGIHFERRTYYALWATEDKKEGMAAFLEKRNPNFTNR